MTVTRGKQNVRDKQLGKIRTINFPMQVRDFIDPYIEDILEREARHGDMKQMLRNAYMLGLLHGNQVGEKDGK